MPEVDYPPVKGADARESKASAETGSCRQRVSSGLAKTSNTVQGWVSTLADALSSRPKSRSLIDEAADQLTQF